MFARSFGSTLLNVGHIILPPPVSMKYWNNCPLGKTPPALTFKGNCKCTINDITQAFSLFYNGGNICESGRCQDQLEKFINVTSSLFIRILCIQNILTEKKSKSLSFFFFLPPNWLKLQVFVAFGGDKADLKVTKMYSLSSHIHNQSLFLFFQPLAEFKF